ncbi:tyrosine-type recombinase/integrase [uncultured Stutzerimonas sp.]|uniref:tyrosine-type recombinase/integrase n=1 Tax=uncultured Stutzerimonas sp. TaxID=2901168 RepID=UPI0032B1F0B1|tara:strand:- start:293 stop:1537 length:1245 start_codon:yes stop_codon:yes gene_type:complete
MKRQDIKRRPLADTVLASLEPEAKEYREGYGVDRIYFVVNPTGRKRWEWRYKKPGTGKWSWLGLGSYPDVSAKGARSKALEFSDMLDRGIDPATPKAQAFTAPLFRDVAERWYGKKIRDGRAEKTLKGIRIALDNDIIPAIGSTPVDQVKRRQCADLQRSIEDRGAHNTAQKVRSWLGQIFGMAIANEWCENNPASNLVDIAEKAPAENQYPHLVENELPEFLRALRTTPCKPLALTAAWMVLRTASRPGMVRFAEWSEIDFGAKLWSVPGKKMKMARDHLVPLPDQVIADLLELQRHSGRSRYLFPSEGPKSYVMSDATINKVFAQAGYKRRMTGHGSRHTCKTILSEHGWPDAWSEMQLAHKKVGLRAVYDKAEYLQQRAAMMQWYADYLQALEEGITPRGRAKFAARVPKA